MWIGIVRKVESDGHAVLCVPALKTRLDVAYRIEATSLCKWMPVQQTSGAMMICRCFESGK